MSSVSVYTGREQTEQPLIVYGVIALSLVGDLLTIEAEGPTFNAMHRFERGQWTHFDVNQTGGPKEVGVRTEGSGTGGPTDA